jgi:hypothetical protein
MVDAWTRSGLNIPPHFTLTALGEVLSILRVGVADPRDDADDTQEMEADKVS